MNNSYRFILIDDVPVNNMLTRKIIEKTYPGCGVVHFTHAQQALDHIATSYSASPAEVYTILLLDIYMPEMDGWTFLERFEQLGDHIRSSIKIWMLSSSISTTDKDRSTGSKIVSGFVLKPFTVNALNELVQSVRVG